MDGEKNRETIDRIGKPTSSKLKKKEESRYLVQFLPEIANRGKLSVMPGQFRTTPGLLNINVRVLVQKIGSRLLCTLNRCYEMVVKGCIQRHSKTARHSP